MMREIAAFIRMTTRNCRTCIHCCISPYTKNNLACDVDEPHGNHGFECELPESEICDRRVAHPNMKKVLEVVLSKETKKLNGMP